MSAWKQSDTLRIWTRETLTTKRRVCWSPGLSGWQWSVIRRSNGEVLQTGEAATMWLAMEAADQVGVTLDPPSSVVYPEQT